MSKIPAPIIDFDTETNVFGVYDRMDWWRSPPVSDWLSAHGYTLFAETESLGRGDPSLPPPSASTCHPYALYSGGNAILDGTELCALNIGRVAYAQDIQRRHVVIKIVKDGTYEYRALRFLYSDSKSWGGDFHCVLPPVDLLQCDQHWFVVMPRWGDWALGPGILHVGEILKFMNDLLKGLVYLHSHHITHGDIRPRNTLVDHFSGALEMAEHSKRPELRRQGLLTYALFDLDRCTVFSPEETRVRLPCQRAWVGAYNSPHDIEQGEIDYDPFAFDVGCMGVMFASLFPSLSPKVPLIAPLFDRMTTWKIEERVSASEALHFLDEARASVSEEDLTRPVFQPKYWDWDDTEKRWEGLPKEFVQKWAPTHKTPPTPLRMWIWRRLCQIDTFYRALIWVQMKLFRWL